MLARALVIIIVATLFLGCMDSQRLRNNLGGPPAAEPRQESKK